ncbi:MAG: ATP--guanido phosphotransferase, partial [Candidatus Latescibacteria bacterium]|nr:ATP--guanido phosphotransferase [Candidatus Latescibacterota bacterium]
LEACEQNKQTKQLVFFDADGLNLLQQQVLVERHVMSPAMMTRNGARGVLVGQAGCLSVMLNEEDHLRFQAIFSGLQPQSAWQAISELQQVFAESLQFAFHEAWGYLTACPSNTGTGLRASVLIHLPGLVLTQEMDAVVRGITQMGFAVRGLFGEGTDALGNMFQVSNQITLGRSEQALLGMLSQAVAQLVECEENAREALLSSVRSKIEDKVWRAWGILQHARMLTSQEFMNLASAVRLGVGLKLIHQVSLQTLNELMVETQPSHLQFMLGRELEAAERDVFRADRVRQKLMPSG